MNTEKVWFVTGASKGLGLALVRKLIAGGYKVAGTSRSEKAFGEFDNEEGFLALKMDPADEKSVIAAIEKTHQQFGKIDVLVNNAGYGHLGAIEELSDAESRKNFDANVFGLLNVIRNAVPQMREKKNGLVINIASIGGFTGDFAGWGIYCATKFAVVGLTEAFAAEVKEFGINATVVYPGYFRTEFLSGGSMVKPQNEIVEYTEAMKIRAAHENDINGSQPGDPDKAAQALIAVSEMERPPVHLFLGSDSFGIAEEKLSVLKEELHANESISKSTDF